MVHWTFVFGMIFNQPQRPFDFFDLYNLYISTIKLQVCQQLFQDVDLASISGFSKQDAFGFKCGSDFIVTYPGLGHPLVPDCLQDGGDEEGGREKLLFWKICELKPEQAGTCKTGDIHLDEVEEGIANIVVEVTSDQGMQQVFILLGAKRAQRRAGWSELMESFSTDQEFMQQLEIEACQLTSKARKTTYHPT